jgi:signal transduction histidine kinase
MGDEAEERLLQDVTGDRVPKRELSELTEQLERRVAERTAELEAASREKDLLLEEAREARAEAVHLLAEIFTERARFQGVVQHLPVGVLVLEAPSGNVVLANESAAATAGRPIVPGEPWDPPEGLAFFREDGSRYAPAELPAARTLQSGEEVRSEDLELRAPGRRAWLEVSSTPVRDRHGQVVSVLVLLRDITVPRRNQVRRLLLDATGEVLRSGFDGRKILRELVLRTVPDFADWAAVDVEAGGIMRLASAHASAGEFDERRAGPPDDGTGSPLVVARVFESGEPIFRSHADRQLAAGLRREAVRLGSIPRSGVSSYLAVPVVSRGKVVAVFSFGTEESDRRLDEDDLAFAVELSRLAGLAVEAAGFFAELESERNRLGRLVDRFRDGVVAVSRDLRVELANPAAEQLLGEELAPGRTLPEPWPDVFELRRLVADLFRSRTAYVERIVSLEKEERTLELVGVPARAEEAAVIVVRDVSERERVERAEREFVANAAHELRTPLAAIASAVEALELGAKDDPANRDLFLGHLKRECERLGRLTESLLVLARAQTRAEPPPAEHIDVRGLLEEIAAGLSPQPGVAVEVDCLDRLEIEANRPLVEQALRSLAENASKFTKAGRIELTARPSNGGVILRVRDSGPGIPAAERERIFGRFYRPSGREPEGFGLGLAIVRESVRAAGGTVDLMTRQDVGTTVRLTFPQAALE